jgi:hypothetical protein
MLHSAELASLAHFGATIHVMLDDTPLILTVSCHPRPNLVQVSEADTHVDRTDLLLAHSDQLDAVVTQCLY